MTQRVYRPEVWNDRLVNELCVCVETEEPVEVRSIAGDESLCWIDTETDELVWNPELFPSLYVTHRFVRDVEPGWWVATGGDNR